MIVPFIFCPAVISLKRRHFTGQSVAHELSECLIGSIEIHGGQSYFSLFFTAEISGLTFD